MLDHSWLVKQLLTCDKLCAFGRWMLIAYSRTAATYSVILHEANYHVHTGQWCAHHFRLSVRPPIDRHRSRGPGAVFSGCKLNRQVIKHNR